MKYLVAEIFPEHNKVYFFDLDNSEKKIIIERAISFASFSDLNDFIKNSAGNNYLKIISLSPLLAETDFTSYKFKRRFPDKVVDETELENLISQLVCDNVSYDQLIVRSINIDGHRAADPLGLTGRDVDIYFSRSRLNEDSKKYLSWVLSFDQTLLIGDAGIFLGHLLSQTLSANNPFILAAIYYNFSSLVFCDGLQISGLQQVNWGEKNLLSVFFGNLLLDQDTAREVWRLYCHKKMSAGFYGKINDFLADEFKFLEGAMQKAVNKSEVNQVFLMPFFDFSSGQ